MDRVRELIAGTQEQKAEQLIDEILFLEGKLKELKSMPFLAVNPKNKSQQKATPAAKLYKELLQQYNNSMKLLIRICGGFEDVEEDSPLRKWVKSRNDSKD